MQYALSGASRKVYFLERLGLGAGCGNASKLREKAVDSSGESLIVY